ncbi:hypothetical protein AMJ86_09990 [bacterium SM23_57]|nr:MAG: hypothetical protein AMJ86_09990 [bacterium SM23_57]
MLQIFSVGIHFDKHPVFLAALLILVWLFTVWVYRHTVPPVASWKRTVLKVLRILALAVVILLLWKPVLSVFVEESDIPILAVLIDDSASMGLVTGDSIRSDDVRAIFESPVWLDVESRFDVRYYAFADSVWVVSGGARDSLAFAYTGTDISGAWQRVPLFTVGIGDSTPAKDAMIVQTITNDIVYAGDVVPLDVRVRGVGIRGEGSVLRLSGPDGENLGTQSIRWKDNFTEETLSFSFTPAEAGTWKYQVSLDPLSDELTASNNRKSFYIKVLESKVSVLVLAGSPSFDLEFLTKSLHENPRITYTLRTQKVQGGYYEGSFPPAGDLDDFDLIILHHYPSSATSMGDLQAVSGAAKRNDCPVLFLMGSEVSLRKLDVITDVIPVRTMRYSGQTVEVSCVGASSHVIFEDDDGQPWIQWDGLPPLWTKPNIFVQKDGSQVIAAGYLQTVGDAFPAIVLRKAGWLKTMAVVPWGLWRWGFQLSQEHSGTLDAFLDRSIRYLVTREEDKLLRITTSKPIYQGGETVRLSAQVYSEGYEPVDGAEVEVLVTAGDETVRLVLDGEGNGRYSGDLSAWTEGEYNYEGTAKRGGMLGEDRGKFTVEAFNIEFLNTAMNPLLLRTVAAQSGGSFCTPETFPELAEYLQFPSRARSVSWEVPIWNRAWLLWIFVGLLSLEWLIRKRSGML